MINYRSQHIEPRLDRVPISTIAEHTKFWTIDCYFKTPVFGDKADQYQPEYRKWIEDSLPPHVRTCHIHAIIPKSCLKPGSVIGKQDDLPEILEILPKTTKFCVSLPAKGQESIYMRMNVFGRPLAEKGICTILLQIPFYGV